VEEAIQAVAESSHDNPLEAFGANEWLVDEMHERYTKDPTSVEQAWVDYFRATDDSAASGNGAREPRAAPAPTKSASQKSEPGKPSSAEPSAQTTPSEAKASAPPLKTAPQDTDGATTRPVETTSADSRPKGTAAQSKPVPKDQPAPAKPTAGDEPEHVVLRGASARTVSNMDT
jgi:2-oxoglutarate dehydrogenase E1 component